MDSYTAFLDNRQIGVGTRKELTQFLLARFGAHADAVLVFDDETGRVADLDYRGVMQNEVRHGVGRPKLGVQPKEVTLLPRHWEWLAQQRGGASATLRRLVDEARASGRTARERQDSAYRFMQAACGDMPGYEEALRALYRSDDAAFQAQIGAWPEDIRAYISKLLSL